MNGAITLAPYRVLEEKQKDFFEVVKNKRKYFLQAGYITPRPALLLQSKIDKNVLIEIFEWTSEKHCEDAHSDKKVQEYWNKMDELWEDGGFGLNTIKESEMKFAHFDPIDIY